MPHFQIYAPNFISSKILLDSISKYRYISVVVASILV